MKRKGDLYSLIFEKSNVELAIKNSSKRKKSRNNVKKVIENIDFYIVDLQNILRKKEYKPSPYYQMKILDGTRKKERIIFKPQYYPDQCIHWALMQIIKPIIERGMYEFCCASVPGRGIHYAARYIKKILVRDRKNTKYCLKLDVKKFYPSINQDILKSKFRKIIKDRDTLDLIDLIIDSTNEGLPIR